MKIDYLEEIFLYNNDNPKEPIKAYFPRTVTAIDFKIEPEEYREHENNVEMEGFLRYAVTKVTYKLIAVVFEYGVWEDRLIQEYGGEKEATGEYNNAINALARGDRVYSFRRSNNEQKNGDNEAD